MSDFVPHDQHALFLPSLKAAEALVVEATSGLGAPIWKALGIDNQLKSTLAATSVSSGSV